MSPTGAPGFSVVVLAAGGSSRLGSPKQLVRLAEEPLVCRAARIAHRSGARGPGSTRNLSPGERHRASSALAASPRRCATATPSVALTRKSAPGSLRLWTSTSDVVFCPTSLVDVHKRAPLGGDFSFDVVEGLSASPAGRSRWGGTG